MMSARFNQNCLLTLGLVVASPLASGAVLTAYVDAGNPSTAAATKFVNNYNPQSVVDQDLDLLDYDNGGDIGTLRYTMTGANFSGTTNSGTDSTGDVSTLLKPFIDVFDSTFAAGNALEILFKDLDPNATYEVVLYSQRNSRSNDHTFTLAGVDAFTNESTGVANPALATYTVSPGHTGGEVAKWTGIDTGADGQFTVTLSKTTGTLYFNGFSLAKVTEDVPEPGSMALIGIGGLLFASRRCRLIKPVS